LALLSSADASAMATGHNQSLTLWDRLRTIPSRLLALAASLGILAWAYWPNLQDLYAIWEKEPNYSHGKLVIPIALVICWRRLADSRVSWTVSKGPWWSWIILVAILAARAFAYERYSQWLETATLIPAVAALQLTLGGWLLLERVWPAVIFLVFMLPLPPLINGLVSLPLQRIATVGSVFMMQLSGLRVMAEGNVIHLPDAPPDSRSLEVALACNGLSMLMTLAATVTATIVLIPLPTWKRVVVLASAIPIALLSNIIRIVATGWCYSLIAGEGAKKFAHDWSGWLMMPLALILVGLELWILSWLAGDDRSTPQLVNRPVLAMFAPTSSDKIKPKFPTDEI
jgi:exosortase